MQEDYFYYFKMFEISYFRVTPISTHFSGILFCVADCLICALYVLYAHKILKRVMSLNLIPHEKIPKMFNYLEKEMEKLFQKGNALFHKKMNMYWSRIFFRTCGNWIAGTVWLPVKGSVFNQHVRTNNDAEGWHNRINERARTKMNFYELVPKLFSEAKMIPLQKRLLCRDRILKRCRKVTAGVNAKLIEL
jgi:hypothetical protein